MRCLVRIAVLAFVFVLALVAHVFISSIFGGSHVEDVREVKRVYIQESPEARPPKSVYYANVTVPKPTTHKNISRPAANATKKNIPMVPDVKVERKRAVLKKVYELPLMTNLNQSANAMRDNDLLQLLYKELRNGPGNVTTETMLEQKIMFIRITMCDSKSLIDPMATVATKNVESVTLAVVPDDISQTRGEGYFFTERLVFENLYRNPIPYISVGGHRFVNFRRYNDFQPISFTVFADPVDRFVEAFYHSRDVYRKRLKAAKGNTTFKLGADALKATLESCVNTMDKNRGSVKILRVTQRRVCGFEMSSLAGAVCGEDRRCSQYDTTNFTLQEALRNLDDFLVIGFTDKLETTVKIMERLLPFYLKGYRQEFLDQLPANQASVKRVLPLSVVDKLRSMMKMDYVIYNEARKRFEELQKQLGI